MHCSLSDFFLYHVVSQILFVLFWLSYRLMSRWFALRSEDALYVSHRLLYWHFSVTVEESRLVKYVLLGLSSGEGVEQINRSDVGHQ